MDGIYEADPVKHPEAKKLLRLTYHEMLTRELKVMDSTAISLAKDNRLPIVVFDLLRPGNIRRALLGEKIGSLVEA